jgi:ribonuclease D
MTGDGQPQKEMQDFMRTHKVIHFSHETFTGGDGNPILIYEFRYVEGTPTVPLDAAIALSKREKYGKDVEELKSKLSERRLVIFDNLASCRKTIAQEDNIGLHYHIFSDKELLYIANLNQISEASISTLKDMTKERAKKYAKRLIDTYRGQFGETLQAHVRQAQEEDPKTTDDSPRQETASSASGLFEE